MQNETRSILSWITTDLALKFLNYVDSVDIKNSKKAVSGEVKVRESTASVTRKHTI